MNYRMIRYTLGYILLFESVFLLIPLITGLCYGESESVLAFLYTALICAAVGGLFLIGKKTDKSLGLRDGFVIVSLSWIVMSIFGALPFVFSGVLPNYIDALFEIASGFSTTGASVIASVEDCPKALLMWRSFSNWIGGMGVLVFVMAFLPLGGAQNLYIMKAESPGPAVSKLVPKVKTTAIILYGIYIILSLLEFILLLFSEMTVFEAINTTFATAGTGGFGVKNDSIYGYSSYVQIVVAVFMLIFSINFNTYYLILCGKLKEALNLEVRTFLIVVASAIVLVTFNVYDRFANLFEALKHVSFTVTSIVSSTGFVTVDFDEWPNFSKMLLFLLMFMGACAGSTGGGMKVSRFILMGKRLNTGLHSILHPKQIKRSTIDGKPVEEEVFRSLNVYLIGYLVVLMLSMLLISLDGYDFVTNCSAVITTLNNIGPGFNFVGPSCNFTLFSWVSKLVLVFDMIAGRLEILPMLLLFSRSTWKK